MSWRQTEKRRLPILFVLILVLLKSMRGREQSRKVKGTKLFEERLEIEETFVLPPHLR